MTTLAEENDFARVALYGRYGMGKSTALAHAALLGTTVVVDAEKRLKPGPLRRLGVPVENIEPHRDVSYSMLKNLVRDVSERLYDDPTSVAAVGLDAVDEIVKLMVRQVLEKELGVAQARADKRGEDIVLNPFDIQRDMWGMMTEQLRLVLRDLRDLPCHLVFTSHERRDLDNDGEVVIGPAANPALQADIMGYVDIMGHVRMDNGWYVALFDPGSKYQAKDVFGVLPKTMANPTMDRIVGYIQGTLTPETDLVQQKYLADKAESKIEIASAVMAGGETGSPRRRRGSSA